MEFCLDIACLHGAWSYLVVQWVSGFGLHPETQAAIKSMSVLAVIGFVLLAPPSELVRGLNTTALRIARVGVCVACALWLAEVWGRDSASNFASHMTLTAVYVAILVLLIAHRDAAQRASRRHRDVVKRLNAEIKRLRGWRDFSR